MVGGVDASRSLSGSISVWPLRPWEHGCGEKAAILVLFESLLQKSCNSPETCFRHSLANPPSPFFLWFISLQAFRQTVRSLITTLSFPRGQRNVEDWPEERVYFIFPLMHSKSLHVDPRCQKWRKALIIRHFRKKDNGFSSHNPLLGRLLTKRRTSAMQMRSTFGLFLSVPARECRFLWEWNVSERRRPPCLPSPLSRLWSANSIVSERSLHLFSSEVSQPPCDAFTRIYKVCNLPCVGFLIFWMAEIKHALLLGGI